MLIDPCAGVTCPDPEVCQLDDGRQPSCRCAEPCPLEFSPICASDGKTYSNECQMHRESCRARKQLKIVFKGQCSTGTNLCIYLIYINKIELFPCDFNLQRKIRNRKLLSVCLSVFLSRLSFVLSSPWELRTVVA